MSAGLTGARGSSSSQWQTPTIGNVTGGNKTRGGDRADEVLLPGQAERLWPTAQAHDAVAGKTQEQIAAMRARTGAGVSNLNEAAERLWATPSTAPEAPNKGSNMQTDFPSLGAQVEAFSLWATPSAHPRTFDPREVDHGAQLANQVQQWATPRASDTNGAGQRRRQLDEAAEQRWNGATPRQAIPTTSTEPSLTPPPSPSGSVSSPSAPTSRPRLNPAFVTWLMALPEGWESLSPLPTSPAP